MRDEARPQCARSHVPSSTAPGSTASAAAPARSPQPRSTARRRAGCPGAREGEREAPGEEDAHRDARPRERDGVGEEQEHRDEREREPARGAEPTASGPRTRPRARQREPVEVPEAHLKREGVHERERAERGPPAVSPGWQERPEREREEHRVAGEDELLARQRSYPVQQAGEDPCVSQFGCAPQFATYQCWSRGEPGSGAARARSRRAAGRPASGSSARARWAARAARRARRRWPRRSTLQAAASRASPAVAPPPTRTAGFRGSSARTRSRSPSPEPRNAAPPAHPSRAPARAPAPRERTWRAARRPRRGSPRDSAGAAGAPSRGGDRGT